MAAASPNSPEVLREAILADARHEAEEILRRARQQTETLLAKAAAEAQQIRREHLDRVRAEALRQRELILATVAVETERLRAARVETWLESIREAVRRRVAARDGLDYRETLIELVLEALSRMTGERFVVSLTPADRSAVGEGLPQELEQRSGRPLGITIAVEPTLSGNGPVIQDPEGRQVWDNRFQSRLERLWPELRRQIAVATSLVPARGSAGASPPPATSVETEAQELSSARQSLIKLDFEKSRHPAQRGSRSPKEG